MVVPAGTTLESTTGTITVCTPLPAAGTTTVTCTVPPLVDSASVTLTDSLRATVQGSIVMGARVPTLAPESNAANNDVTETTKITAGSDLALSVGGRLRRHRGGLPTMRLPRRTMVRTPWPFQLHGSDSSGAYQHIRSGGLHAVGIDLYLYGGLGCSSI